MSNAILVSIGFAGLSGLPVGFGKHWKAICLVACVVVPLVSATALAIAIDAPSLFDRAGWGLVTFLYALMCAFIIWGICAGVNHGAQWLYRKLSHRADEDRPGLGKT